MDELGAHANFLAGPGNVEEHFVAGAAAEIGGVAGQVDLCELAVRGNAQGFQRQGDLGAFRKRAVAGLGFDQGNQWRWNHAGYSVARGHLSSGRWFMSRVNCSRAWPRVLWFGPLGTSSASLPSSSQWHRSQISYAPRSDRVR